MNSVFKCVFIVSMMSASGCATPPGKLNPNDLNHAKFNVSQPLPIVIERLQEADRNCGGLIAEWAPTWYPITSSDKYKIDLFLRGIDGSKQGWVAGFIDLEKVSQNLTEMTVSVQKLYSHAVFRRTNWWTKNVESMVKDLNAGRSIACE